MMPDAIIVIVFCNLKFGLLLGDRLIENEYLFYGIYL